MISALQLVLGFLALLVNPHLAFANATIYPTFRNVTEMLAEEVVESLILLGLCDVHQLNAR